MHKPHVQSEPVWMTIMVWLCTLPFIEIFVWPFFGGRCTFQRGRAVHRYAGSMLCALRLAEGCVSGRMIVLKDPGGSCHVVSSPFVRAGLRPRPVRAAAASARSAFVCSGGRRLVGPLRGGLEEPACASGDRPGSDDRCDGYSHGGHRLGGADPLSR